MTPRTGGRTLVHEAHYPHPADALYDAAMRVARSHDLTLNSYDALAKTITLSTPPSIFTWGETVTLACHPTTQGSTLKVQIKGRIGGQLFQAPRNTKVMGMLLDRIAAELAGGTAAD